MRRLLTLTALTLALPVAAAVTAAAVWVTLRKRGISRAAEYPAELARIDGEAA